LHLEEATEEERVLLAAELGVVVLGRIVADRLKPNKKIAREFLGLL
jgi:hypothetical protein